MAFSTSLICVRALEPLLENAEEWLKGDEEEPPVWVQELPTELRADVELRLRRARAELRA
jgi:hypothetical protein